MFELVIDPVEFEVRTHQDEDIPFIFATWLKSYKKESYFAKRIKNTIFYKWHHKIIESIISRSRISIAHMKDNPDIILAYAIYETGMDGPVVHYIFVKPEFRQLGIAKQMISNLKISLDNCTFTHWTYPVDELIKKLPNMTYDPYRI